MTLSPRAVEAAVKAIDKLDHRKAISMADLTRQIAEAAITTYLAALAVDGLCLVPVNLTEDMAEAMECEFSTEAQWAAALAAASTGDSPPAGTEG